MKCDRLSCGKDATDTVTIRFHSGRVKRESLCVEHGELVHASGLCGSMARVVSGVERNPIPRSRAQHLGNRALELSAGARAVSS